MDKGEVRELTPDEMEEMGVKWGAELLYDLTQSDVAMSDSEKEIIGDSRKQLLRVLDFITAHRPAEPNEEWSQWVHEMLGMAIHARNCVRGTFLKAAGHSIPKRFERIEGTLH